MERPNTGERWNTHFWAQTWDVKASLTSQQKCWSAWPIWSWLVKSLLSHTHKLKQLAPGNPLHFKDGPAVISFPYKFKSKNCPSSFCSLRSQVTLHFSTQEVRKVLEKRVRYKRPQMSPTSERGRKGITEIKTTTSFTLFILSPLLLGLN